jgi:hypothetical protein
MSAQPSELGRFQAVSEDLVLIAVERAQRHDRKRGDPVSLIRIGEHLGFMHGAYTTRHMRPLLSALVEAGALEHSRRMSRDHWALTSAARRRLGRARRRGEQLQLPEAPQHRLWREKHTQAVEGMGEYGARLREALEQAAAMIDDERADSEAWRTMTKRLEVRSELFGSAIYCAREWAEPDDGERDVDDQRTLDHRRRILWHPDARRRDPAPAVQLVVSVDG